MGSGIMDYGILSGLALCPQRRYSHWYFDNGLVTMALLPAAFWPRHFVPGLLTAGIISHWHFVRGIMSVHPDTGHIIHRATVAQLLIYRNTSPKSRATMRCRALDISLVKCEKNYICSSSSFRNWVFSPRTVIWSTLSPISPTVLQLSSGQSPKTMCVNIAAYSFDMNNSDARRCMVATFKICIILLLFSVSG